jgi:magnesium-protoporphyrin O-methyltransferase
MARRNLQQYRQKGLGAIERQMVSSIRAADLDGARVLEIGGGIGAIQAELLAAGAREGEIVELVSAYEPYARELAREKGFATRSHFRVADILDRPEAASSAEIVVLNRVVCCSPDGIRLVELSARLSERVLVFSFPRDRLLVRTGAALINAFQRVLGRSFRAFLHPRASLCSAAERQGLELSGAGRTFVWEFVAFRRVHPVRP